MPYILQRPPSTVAMAEESPVFLVHTVQFISVVIMYTLYIRRIKNVFIQERRGAIPQVLQCQG